MTGSIEAVGNKASAQASTDVFALGDRDGTSISKAKQTAAAKSSLWVTYGEKNHAAGVFAKTTERAKNLDDRLHHRDVELVNGVDFGRQNGLPEPNA